MPLCKKPRKNPRKNLRKAVLLSTTCGVSLVAPAAAGEMHLSADIPLLSVATYHRPYVAFWVETPEQKFVRNLALWHQVKSRNNEANKYLKDLRLWWRKSGRELDFPVDGVSGASRAPGAHVLVFTDEAASAQTAGEARAGAESRGGGGGGGGSSRAPAKLPRLTDLPAGDYHLVVEAAREAGGREVLRLPFQWPLQSDATITAQGETELGAVALTFKSSDH